MIYLWRALQGSGQGAARLIEAGTMQQGHVTEQRNREMATADTTMK